MAKRKLKTVMITARNNIKKILKAVCGKTGKEVGVGERLKN
jgi:hypothetical protein